MWYPLCSSETLLSCTLSFSVASSNVYIWLYTKLCCTYIQFERQNVVSQAINQLRVDYNCKMGEKNGTMVNTTTEGMLFASVLGVPGYFAVNAVAIALVCGVGGTLNAVILIALLCNRHCYRGGMHCFSH